MAISPLRILIILAFWSLGSSFYKNTEKQYDEMSKLLYLDTEKWQAPGITKVPQYKTI